MRLADARILIADDEADLLDNLAEIVEDEGATVVRASTGAEALARASGGFDVALVDVGLPDAEGDTLVPRLREAAPGAEVILMTGQGSLEAAIRAVRVGAYDYVLKPFDPDALLASVERALRLVRAARAEQGLRKALRQERDFTAAVLDTAGALVLVLDREGRVVRFNRACEALTGHSYAEVAGRPIWGLFPFVPEEAQARAMFQAMLDGGKGASAELHWRVRGGGQRLIAWTNTTLPDETGRVAYVVATGLDVTEHRRAEHELQALHVRLGEEHARLLQAEKLSSIGQLSAGVAHEINNPLGGVMSCFRALRAGTIPAARLPEYFETIDDGLQRMASIVRGLLDYARQRPPRREAVDLASVTALSVRLVEPSVRGKGLRLVDELSPGALRAEADRSQVMQALVNVLLNAAHASPEQGEIVLRPAQDGHRVGVRISDQGPGIPAEIRHKVGEPFFTTKPEGEGTGLGLSITHGIMKAHGGSIEIDSAPGAGTTVTLWLPAAG